jgi:hypothetical protein
LIRLRVASRPWLEIQELIDSWMDEDVVTAFGALQLEAGRLDEANKVRECDVVDGAALGAASEASSVSGPILRQKSIGKLPLSRY